MKKLEVKNVNLSGKDVAWIKKIDEFFNSLDGILCLCQNNISVSIDRVYRIGCDLEISHSIKNSWNGPSDDLKACQEKIAVEARQWRDIVDGRIEVLKKQLLPICPRCGKDKGIPPSTTVRPGLCEECRGKLTKADYENTIAIGMIGKAGSGKDTVCDYLSDKHNFRRIALADPLRDIAQLFLVADRQSVWDRKIRELPLTFLRKMIDGTFWSVRKLLQYMGTEMFRVLIDDSVWVRNASQRMEPDSSYIISDVRFPNEVDLLRNNFGGRYLLIKVTRPGYDGKGVGIAGHASEAHDLEADITVENDGALEDLYQKIEKILRDYNVV
jgi:hypothetical protein